jgi:asparagine synthetase B (glutamine-hydrolysing)
MLPGEGADSVFGGPYWAFMILLSYATNILQGGVRKWFNEMSKKIKETSFLSKSFVKSLKTLSTPLREYMLYGHSIGDEDTVDKVFGAGTWKRTINDRQRLIGKDPLSDLISFLMLDWFPATIGANIRLGFEHDLIFLFPFFDYELMQNSFRLPIHLRYHYTTKKAALKFYARNFFDREFIYKPKEGFGVPLGKWFTKPEFKPFLNLPLEERSLKRGWWNESELKKVIDLHIAGYGTDKSAESIPWIAKNMELWARICLEGDSPDAYKIS